MFNQIFSYYPDICYQLPDLELRMHFRVQLLHHYRWVMIPQGVKQEVKGHEKGIFCLGNFYLHISRLEQ